MDKRIDFNEGSYKQDLYQSLGPSYSQNLLVVTQTMLNREE